MEDERTALIVDERAFTLREVLAYGFLAGLVDPTLHRLDHVRRSVAAAPNARPSPAEIRKGVRAWRVAAGLSSAADTEAFFTWHHLSLGDVNAWVERSLRWSTLRALATELGDPGDVSSLGLLSVELLLEGGLERFAETVGTHIAVATADGDDCGAGASASAASRVVRAKEAFGVSNDFCQQAIAWEASYRDRRDAVATASAVAVEIETRARDFTRIVTLAAALPSESAAREVLMCIRFDGENISALGERLSTPLQREDWLLGAAPATLGPRSLGAARGDVFGPTRDGDEWLVRAVAERLEPDPDSVEVRHAAAEAIVRRKFRVAALERLAIPRQLMVPPPGFKGPAE